MNSINADKQRRPFFLGVGAFLIAVAVYKFVKTPEQIPVTLVGTGGFFAAVDFVIPPLSRLIFRGWMAFALVLGTVNTWILISLVYFLLMTPIAILMRLFQKAGPLSPKTWKARRSSWVSLEDEVKNRNYYAPY